MTKNQWIRLALAATLFTTRATAQNVGINEDGSPPNPNAILDVKSFNKGILIPRVSTAGRLAIPNTKGMLVYDTTVGAFIFNTGSAWQNLSAGISGWSLTGNSGDSGTKFLGTTDNSPLQFIVHGAHAGFMDSASSNTYFGFKSGTSNPGGGNAVFGSGSFTGNTVGFQNTAIGAAVMRSNITGIFNTAIGSFADVSTGNLTNATAIGASAIVNASNKVRIGNGAVTVIEGQVPFTTPSDGRFKYLVKEDVKGLSFILQLRPVTYQFDVQRFDAQQRHTNGQASSANYAVQAAYKEAAAIRRTGFIAQEVEKAATATGYDFSGVIRPRTEEDHYGLSYESFVVPLVKAVQEQQKIIADLQKQIDELKKQISK